MEGKRPRGRPKLWWNDTVRRDQKAWQIKEEWATDRERWSRRRKVRKVRNTIMQTHQQITQNKTDNSPNI